MGTQRRGVKSDESLTESWGTTFVALVTARWGHNGDTCVFIVCCVFIELTQANTLAGTPRSNALRHILTSFLRFFSGSFFTSFDPQYDL